jgi:hypothetical protein
MIFSDGAVAVTALSMALVPCEKGIARALFPSEILLCKIS